VSSVAILTRAPEDNAPLAAELRSRGVRVLEVPCVRTEPLADASALCAAIGSVGPDDVLVLTSRAGADAVAACARTVPCGVAAVGTATADRARELGMRVSFVPSAPSAGALARELPLPTGEVVLARSDLADASLPHALRERGARVREVIAYRTVAAVHGDARAARSAIEREEATVVAASPSAVDALLGAVGEGALRGARFVAIGERTAEHVRRRLGTAVTVARGTDAASLADAVSPHLEVAP
jgi:uroporphyrinogen III methyltransferase / synthase